MSGYDVNYDVIICGGGTSGFAAAIASARNGAKTLLIEKTGCIGGQLAVSGPPGFAYARLFNCFDEQDTAGIVEETHRRLFLAGHAQPHLRYHHRVGAGYSFSYVDPEWWVLMAFNMLEEEGVILLLDTLVVDVVKDGDTVTGVVVENANGRNTIHGKIVIDCTGEAYIAIKAGCETVQTDRDIMQPHTICFTADGVNWDRVLEYIHNNPDQFTTDQLAFPGSLTTKEEAVHVLKTCTNISQLGEVMGYFDLREMALSNGDWHPYSGVGFFLQPKEGGKILAHFQHSSQVDHCLPTDAWDITRCHIECRKQIQIAWRFFKNYVPGFEDAYIVKIGTEIRFREGPRIVGDYVLTTEDVGAVRQFPDTIGKSNFPAGAHHTANVNTLACVGEQENNFTFPQGSYDIPYRCLVPKKIENFLAAGKCVSTDRDAYLRYLQQTMVTGQAAGTAAALCVKKGITPREMEKDYADLQKSLVDQGAILFDTIKPWSKRG
jgi:hypothetical protein